MKKEQFINLNLKMLLIALGFLCSSTALWAQTIYGISAGGELISIDNAGVVTNLGSIGMTESEDGIPTGLTYNPNAALFYICTNIVDGSGKKLSYNMETGEIEDLGNGICETPFAMCYSFVADYEIIAEHFATGVYITQPVMPKYLTLGGFITVTGMTVRPTDGKIFAVGRNSSNDQVLFTISLPEPWSAATSVSYHVIGEVSRSMSALTFKYDGTLIGSSGFQLYTINTASGEVSDVAYADVGEYITGLTLFLEPSPGDIDVMIRDCVEDIGDVPTVPAPPCNVIYMSPDIWVDNNNDMIIDNPVYAEYNLLKARIKNRGSGLAENVRVNFYFRNSSTGLQFPEGARRAGEDIITVPPNGEALAQTNWMIPPDPEGNAHWCVGVVIDHPDDPAPVPAPSAEQHNNIAVANIWHLAARAGQQESLSFSMGTAGGSGFGFSIWPRVFRLDIYDSLPKGWTYKIEGVQNTDSVVMKLEEEKEIKINIVVPKEAKKHAGGSIDIKQVDVLTQRVVGGLNYTIYEDHIPPVRVEDLRVSIVDGYPLLEWENIYEEDETGLIEHVSYYEIIRQKGFKAKKDTKHAVILKAVIDIDSEKPGFQWIDSTKITNRVSYSIRAIDQGGNVSEISPQLTIKAPCANLVWVIIVLIILILIILFLVILLIRARRGRP